MYLARELEETILSSLQSNPATAVLGPRQCGKSTLVKHILSRVDDALYLDLERPSDLSKLDQAEWFLSANKDRLICLDEVQRKPELFPLLRSLIDEERRAGKFLILGSASRELLKQSSESLAGRISFKSLTPFLWSELGDEYGLETYMSRGGFPLSFLSSSDGLSYEWRLDFINTFLERDVLQFAGVSARTMRRLWQMLAHNNGQTINFSSFGSSLGVSHTTIRNYMDLLEGTFMIRQILPYGGNTLKRLVKSPKVYISDSGITSALLGLKSFEENTGHSGFGALWESTVLANLYGHFPNLEYSFFRTSYGAEIDFVLIGSSRKIAIECKASVAPSLTKGNYSSLEEIRPDMAYVVSPVKESYPISENIMVCDLQSLIQQLGEYFD